jgi:hypothetical protein
VFLLRDAWLVSASQAMSLSVTGHRPHLLGGYLVQPALEHLALITLADMRPQRVCTGMALGWDQAIAAACITLDIPFVAVLPGFASGGYQCTRWPAASQARFHQLLAAAAEIERCPFPGAGREFHHRDQRLVERCDDLLALWNGDPKTGTGITVTMARGKPVHNVWGAWHGSQ